MYRMPSRFFKGTHRLFSQSFAATELSLCGKSTYLPPVVGFMKIWTTLGSRISVIETSFLYAVAKVVVISEATRSLRRFASADPICVITLLSSQPLALQFMFNGGFRLIIIGPGARPP